MTALRTLITKMLYTDMGWVRIAMRITPGVLSMVVNSLSVCYVKRYIVIGVRSYLNYKGHMD